MHVEGDLLRVRAPMLVVEAVCVFAVFCRCERVVAGGYAAFVDLVAAGWCLDLRILLVDVPLLRFNSTSMSLTYPEVNFQVSAATKLSVADLEGNGHLVVLVQRFVEAFALVSLHLDVVCRGK